MLFQLIIADLICQTQIATQDFSFLFLLSIYIIYVIPTYYSCLFVVLWVVCFLNKLYYPRNNNYGGWCQGLISYVNTQIGTLSFICILSMYYLCSSNLLQLIPYGYSDFSLSFICIYYLCIIFVIPTY